MLGNPVSQKVDVMAKGSAPIERFFNQVVLKHPVIVLVCLFLLLSVLGYFAKNFRIEASAETLIQQSNEDYLYFQKIIGRFGVEDFVIITYTPATGDVLTEAALEQIDAIQDQVEALADVESVVTILDLPMLQYPRRPLEDMLGDIKTLRDPGVDRAMARKELQNSPLYQNLLVSPDLKTTALQINFKPDPVYNKLWQQRQRLRRQAEQGPLSDAQAQKLDQIQQRIEAYQVKLDKNRHQNIVSIREILDKYEEQGDLFLGGLGVIADDLMRFVRNDLQVFSGGVLVFLILALGLIFRRIRWIVLPILCCAFSVFAMIGVLGYFQWKVTIVSANFVALQLIMTMALSIHLVVRYRELLQKYPYASHMELTRDMVVTMKTPCFYAALTTGTGFGSLWFSDILPVETFGWMMTAGIAMSLLMTFTFFPAALVLFRKVPPPAGGGGGRLAVTRLLSRFTELHGRAVIVISLAALIFGAAGISQLRVENSFLNYFKPSTEIYQGLKVVDRHLGGTTTLDVIIDFEKAGAAEAPSAQARAPGEADAFDDFAEFEAEQEPGKYWFTPHRLNRIEAVHDYLNQREHAGKVLSLAILQKIARDITGGPLDSFELSLLFNEFPEEYRDMLVKPFVSVEHDQSRINLRVIDSHESLRRNDFINEVRHDLTHELGFKEDNVKLTGMLVLYNDVLQSLFESQILTLGVVVAILMGMFLILFRIL